MISFYFCWGERGKQVKSMLGKCQVAGVWSGPWGMSRSFVGWEVGKSHCRPRKQHGQQHGGVNLSSATGDGFSECDVPGTVGAVGDAATETRTWKSGLKCEPRPGEQRHLHPLAWISRSAFKLHLWLWIAFCPPRLIRRVLGILAVVLGRQTGVCVQMKVSNREPAGPRSSADRLLQALGGALVPLRQASCWIILAGFEAHLVGLSSALFPGVDLAGSDSLRPVEGHLTGLNGDLFPYC